MASRNENTGAMVTFRTVPLLVGLLSAAACTQSGSNEPAPVAEGTKGTATVDLPGFGPRLVEYVVKDGKATYFGDIVLSDAQLAAPVAVGAAVALPSQHVDSVGRQLQTYRWPSGQIPYVIDTALFPVGGSDWNNIKSAMAMWASPKTPVTFVACPTSVPWQPVCPGYTDFLVIEHATNKDGSLCVDNAGRSNSIGRLAGTGKHEVFICVGSSPVVIAHEIGHIIGLYHEMQRSDRDQSLIVYDGLSPAGCSGASCYPNRFGCPGGDSSGYLRFGDTWGQAPNYGDDGVNLSSALDVSSIMIYNSVDCCGLGFCMTKIDGTPVPTPTGATASDLAGVTRMYSTITQSWIGRSNIILL
jgi:hypothetical protein